MGLRFSEIEEGILKEALPHIYHCPVIQHILNGTYLKEGEPEKNRSELDAYRKEAILSALLTPLYHLFFISRGHLILSANIHLELTDYLQSNLQNWFSANATAKISKGKNIKKTKAHERTTY